MRMIVNPSQEREGEGERECVCEEWRDRWLKIEDENEREEEGGQ